MGTVTVIDKEARRGDNTLRIVYHQRSNPPLKGETFKNVKTLTAAHKILLRRNKDTIKSAIYNGDVIFGVKLTSSNPKPKKKKHTSY